MKHRILIIAYIGFDTASLGCSSSNSNGTEVADGGNGQGQGSGLADEGGRAVDDAMDASTSGPDSAARGEADAGVPSAADAATTHGTSTCLMAGDGDYSKAGPYAVTTETGIDLTSTGDLPPGDAGVRTGALYYPTNLDDGCPHPIVSWANGTGVDSSTALGAGVYAFFHRNLASWGIVVLAADNPNSAGPNFIGTTGPYNRAGIDYLLKENDDATGPLYRHLSTRAGVAGHSQGGYAATAATQHPNVAAEVQIEGGGVPKAGIDFLALTGSSDTVVTPGPPGTSYNAATGPSMFANYTGADHTTTPTELGYAQMNPGTTQFLRFYTAWFRCFLADDQVACAMFKGGSGCGVCKDPNWTSLKTKDM